MRVCAMPGCQTSAGCKCGQAVVQATVPTPAWPPFVVDMFKTDAEELRIWREQYPRMAGVIRERARAKIENRKPDYGPNRIYG